MYLDNNATAPVRPEVIEEVCRVLEMGGNPSSVHYKGRSALHILENARKKIAAAIGADSEQIIFTSGGTEANNLALKGVVGRSCLLVGATEHDAVLQSAANLDRDVVILPVDNNGLVVREALLDAIDQRGGVNCLVSVMLANNETGVIQPVAELCRAAKERGALFHTDAVQALGKMPLDFNGLGVDMMSLSAHKMGGPQGVGALVIRENVPIRALMEGGGQERRRRSGTENLPAIAGFAKATDFLMELIETTKEMGCWRDRFEEKITTSCPKLIVHGQQVARLPNSSCISMPGVASETIVMAMDLAGICISAGSACSSGKVKASHVLKAMGMKDAVAGSSIRVSLGWQNQEQDLDVMQQKLLTLYQQKVKAE